MRPIALLAALIVALSLTAPAASAAAGDWTWPVRGDVVTPYRNGDDPYAAGQHRGIDIAAPVGTAVVAATSGRVTFAGVAGVSGLTVSMRTADGRYDLSYLHLSAAAVHEGDAVERGERVGAVGTSGRRSATEPHLHFGVRDAGARQAYHDPLAFLPAPAPPAEEPRAPAPAPDEAPAAVPPAPVAVAAPDASPPAVPVGVGVGVGAAVPAGAPAATAAPGLPAHGPSFGHGLWFERALAARHSNSTGAAVLRGEPHRAGAGHAPAHRGHVRGSEPRQGGTRHRALNPAAGPRGVPVQEAAAPPATRRLAAQHPSSSGAHRGGVDIGWLAALIGLVLAAVCLGRPDASARVARRGRDRLGALLRPVGGRG